MYKYICSSFLMFVCPSNRCHPCYFTFLILKIYCNLKEKFTIKLLQQTLFWIKLLAFFTWSSSLTASPSSSTSNLSLILHLNLQILRFHNFLPVCRESNILSQLPLASKYSCLAIICLISFWDCLTCWLLLLELLFRSVSWFCWNWGDLEYSGAFPVQ